jgi:hypothetical protein
VADGVFQTALGSVTTLPGSIDFNTDNIYLGVEFNGDPEMSPRIQFTAVPQAFNAERVAGLTVTNTTGTLTIPNGKTISFADEFSTSGAFPLTLTATATTNATLPSGTVTLAGLDTAQTLTNKTIGSTGLTFSGATTDLTTVSNEDLTITPNGTGKVVLGKALDTGLNGIINAATISGGTAANSTLVLQGNTASSGNTATNASIQFMVGDSGGTTAMTILNNGRVGIGTAAPTNSLTIPSTGNGVAIYNTVDQTTNTESLNMQWLSNIGSIGTAQAGTGTFRAMQVVGSEIRLRTATTYTGVTTKVTIASAGEVTIAPASGAGTSLSVTKTGGGGGYLSSFSGTGSVLINSSNAEALFAARTLASSSAISDVLNVGGFVNTPLAGAGTALKFSLNSSTTASQDTARIAAAWTDSTHATRTSQLTFDTVNAGTLSTKMTIAGNGTIGIGTAPTGRHLTVGASGLKLLGSLFDNRDNTWFSQSADSVASNRDMGIGNATYSTVRIPAKGVGIGLGPGGTGIVAADLNTITILLHGGMSTGSNGLGVAIVGQQGNTSVGSNGGNNNGGNVTIDAGPKAGSGIDGSIILGATTGNVGVGTSGPDRKLDVLDASNPQMRLTYTDASVYTDFQTTSSGDLTISPSGGDATINGVTNVSLTLQSNGSLKDSVLNLNGSDRAMVKYTNTNSFYTGMLQSTTLWGISTTNASTGFKLVVDTSGNVGIGDTSPASLFTVGTSDAFQINASGQVTSGTWQGTAVGAAYGGTGLSSYTAGDLLYASGTTTIAKLGIGSNGNCLVLSSSLPSWGSCGAFTEADTLADVAGRGASTSTAVALNGGITSSKTAGTALALTGAPTDSATSALFQLGSALSGGDATADGGTYIGLNAPASGAGSVADLMNLQVNGASKFKITSAGAISAVSLDVADYLLNGVNLNTAGTLSNVAYLNQANVFTAAITLSSAGTGLSVTNDASIGGSLTIGGTVITTPSAIQTVLAADLVLADAGKVRVAGSGAPRTLTSTPTIADGGDGQLLIIQGTDDTDTVTFQDQGTLPTSNLELGASTRVLGKGDILTLTFDATDSVWYEVSFTDN